VVHVPQVDDVPTEIHVHVGIFYCHGTTTHQPAKLWPIWHK
jgi:hypothetical protein